ncbi:unnamed protein product, partial [Symbiodinium sp. CCMP2456]
SFDIFAPLHKWLAWIQCMFNVLISAWVICGLLPLGGALSRNNGGAGRGLASQLAASQDTCQNCSADFYEWSIPRQETSDCGHWEAAESPFTVGVGCGCGAKFGRDVAALAVQQLCCHEQSYGGVLPFLWSPLEEGDAGLLRRSSRGAYRLYFVDLAVGLAGFRQAEVSTTEVTTDAYKRTRLRGSGTKRGGASNACSSCPSGHGSAGQHSEDKRMLHAFVEQLSKQDNVPEEIRELMAKVSGNKFQQEAKELHKMVQTRTSAFSALNQIDSDRAVYEQAWANYSASLIKMLQDQLQQRQQTLQEFDTAQAEWTAKLKTVTQQIKQTTQPGAGSSAEVAYVDSSEGEDMEAEVAEDAERDAKREQRRQEMLAQHDTILQALQQVQDWALANSERREGSRRWSQGQGSSRRSRSKGCSGWSRCWKAFWLSSLACRPDTGELISPPFWLRVKHSIFEDGDFVDDLHAGLAACAWSFECQVPSCHFVPLDPRVKPFPCHGHHGVTPSSFQGSCRVGCGSGPDEEGGSPLVGMTRSDDGSTTALRLLGRALSTSAAVTRAGGSLSTPAADLATASGPFSIAPLPRSRSPRVLLKAEAAPSVMPGLLLQEQLVSNAQGSRHLQENVQAAAAGAHHGSRSLFSILEPRSDHLSRGCFAWWGREDYVAYAKTVVPYVVRTARFLHTEIPGIPSPQLLLTGAAELRGHKACPVDLRAVGGQLHTVVLPPAGDVSIIGRLLHDKGAADIDLPPDGCDFFAPDGSRVVSWTCGAELPEWLSVAVGLPVSGPRPFWPTEVARILAAGVEVTPSHLNGPLMSVVLGRLAELEQPDFDPSTLRGHYTVFEVSERPRTRASYRDWTLADYVADACVGARRVPRAVQVVSRPIHGYPVPQLVLTPRDAEAGHQALLCDWRGRGHGVVTVLCPPSVDVGRFEELIERDLPFPGRFVPAAVPVVMIQDAFSRQHLRVATPVCQYDWVVPVLDIQEQEPDTGATSSDPVASTTQTVTCKLPFEDIAMAPEGTAKQVAARRPSTHSGSGPAVPHVQYRPLELVQNLGSQPLAASFLFPDLAGAGGSGLAVGTHYFAVIAWDRPVGVLPAAADWSLASFFQAAETWLGHAPRIALLLTHSVPNLPAPQFVLTDYDVPASAEVVPLDLRPWGGDVVPLVAVPGSAVGDVLNHLPGLPPVLGQVPLHHDLFLQDARGGLHAHIPEDLSDVQWFRVCRAVVGPDASPFGCADGVLTSTSTTTTGMHAESRSVRFVLTGGATTLQLPPVPVSEADPVHAIGELLFAVAACGRLKEGAAVTLGAGWPAPSRRGEYIVPFVVSAFGDEVQQSVLFDPSYDGSQLYAMGVQQGLHAEDLMSTNYRQCGLTLWVNGVHSSAVIRPLRTGDYVQLLPNRVITAPTAIHPEVLLSSINRLRAISAPLLVPDFPRVAARASHVDARVRSRAALHSALDLSTRARVELMGLPPQPGQAAQPIVLLEPGRAPHHLYLPLRLTPTLEEAEDSLRDTHIVPATYRFVDTIEDGAHVATARPITYAPVARRSTTVRSTPSRSEPASASASMDTAVSGAAASSLSETMPPADEPAAHPEPTLSEGTSLIQIPDYAHAKKLRCRQARQRGVPLEGCQDLEAPPQASFLVSVATPFGRRGIPAQDKSACAMVQPEPERTMLSLCDLVPQADTPVEGVIHFPVPAELPDQCWESYDIAGFAREMPAGLRLHPAAADLLGKLDHWDGLTGFQAAMLYVDGSFHNKKAAWAVVAFVLVDGVWLWAGFIGGSLAEAFNAQSVYEAELMAQLAAHCTAAGCSVPTVIYYDSTSAATAADGRISLRQPHPIAEAVASIAVFLQCKGKRPLLQHVAAHTGNPANELADSLAKFFLDPCAPKGPDAVEPMADSILRGDLGWLWVRAASGVMLPSLDVHGESTIAFGLRTVRCGFALIMFCLPKLLCSGLQPLNRNANHWLAILREYGLCQTGVRSSAGELLRTWVSPSGHSACLDYIAYPAEWSGGVGGIRTVAFLDEFAGFDHFPLLADVKLRLETAVHQCQAYDVEAMHSEDVDGHVEVLSEYIHDQLATHFLPSTGRQLLHVLFGAWRNCVRGEGDINVAQLRVRVKAADRQAATFGARMRELQTRIRAAYRADVAAFTRHMWSEAKGAGPAELARVLRSVLKAGRSYKPPRVAVALNTPQGPIVEPGEVADLFGRTFAVAEHAAPVDFAALQACDPALDCVDQRYLAEQLPSVTTVAAAFSSLKPRRASGPSRIPADFYAAAPLAAALAHMPVLLKTLLRARLPLLWGGCVSRPLLKPGKPADDVASYRAIALQEPAAKALNKALRPQLCARFEDVALSGVGGARPAFALSVPSLTVQSALAYSCKQGLSVSALFLDGVAAFYATSRATLFTQDRVALEARLRQGPYADDVVAAFLAFLPEEGSLAGAGVNEATCDFLRASMKRTWYTTNPQSARVYETSKGTIPGAPLADILFQYVLHAAISALDFLLKRDGLALQVAGQSAAPCSWLDDLTLLVCSTHAAGLTKATVAAACLAHQCMGLIGIDVNYGPNKTEALMIWKGPGSQKARASALLEAGGKLCLGDLGQGTRWLRCTDNYTHLGSVRATAATATADLERRASLAHVLYRPLPSRLLNNPELTLAERRNLLFAGAFASYLHNVGTWTLSTGAEQRLYQRHYMKLVKGSIRPLFGVPSRRLTDVQACAVVGALTPHEALASSRVRVLAQVASRGSPFLWALLIAEREWLVAARGALELVHSVVSNPSVKEYLAGGLADSFSAWPFTAAQVSGLLRKFKKIAVASRNDLAEEALAKATVHHQAATLGFVFVRLADKPVGGAIARCEDCGQTFGSVAACAAHRSAVHGLKSEASHGFGTDCQVCAKRYWTRARLRDHLRRSAVCASVYKNSDIQEGQLVAQAPGQCNLPVVPLIGPRPWWATLVPRNDTECLPTPALSFEPHVAFCRYRYHMNYPAFFACWSRAVETGHLAALLQYFGLQEEGTPEWMLATRVVLALGRNQTGQFVQDQLVAVVREGCVLFGPKQALKALSELRLDLL